MVWATWAAVTTQLLVYHRHHPLCGGPWPLWPGDLTAQPEGCARYPVGRLEPAQETELLDDVTVGLGLGGLNAPIGELDVAAGTAWLWARPGLAASVDTLFVDEAGQLSLANVLAVAGAARNLVLLGDPQQLARPFGRTIDLALRCCLQVGHGRLAVQVRDNEVSQQAGVGAAGADDLDGGLGVLRYLGQAVELAPHHLAAADGAVQDALVQDAPELGRTRSVQNRLSGPGGRLPAPPGPRGCRRAGEQDRAGVLLGLQQAGHDERLVPAQDRGLGFDAGPLLEPYRRCLWPFSR
jgi:hypothetical protein